MIRLTIVDQNGKVLLPRDVANATELLALVEQARVMIRDCESLTRQHKKAEFTAPGSGQVPYLS
jgi:hypothetical protein